MKRHKLLLATLTLSFLVTLVIGTFSYGEQHPDRRPLTQTERDVIEEIFGSTFDDSDIFIAEGTVFSTFSPITLGETVHQQSPTDSSTTTSALSRQDKFSLIHEVAHVWQYQEQGWSYLVKSFATQLWSYFSSGSRLNAYEWSNYINTETAFKDWNVEAQAEAIADFGTNVILEDIPTSDSDILELGCIIPLFSKKYCIATLN